MKNKLLVLVITILFSSPALAWVELTGKVVFLEATYMPGLITFQMDTGNSVCPPGTWLKWAKDIENNKIVYSTLMTAIISGRKINLFLNEGDTTCTGAYLHLRND